MQWVARVGKDDPAPVPTNSELKLCPSKLLLQILNLIIMHRHVPQRQPSILIWFSLERTWKRTGALILSGVCLVKQRAVGQPSNAINTFCNLDRYILQFKQINLCTYGICSQRQRAVLLKCNLILVNWSKLSYFSFQRFSKIFKETISENFSTFTREIPNHTSRKLPQR